MTYGGTPLIENKHDQTEQTVKADLDDAVMTFDAYVPVLWQIILTKRLLGATCTPTQAMPPPPPVFVSVAPLLIVCHV